MFIYAIDMTDNVVHMKVKKRINTKRLKNEAKKYIDETFGPKIYRACDIKSVKLISEKS